MKTTVRKHPRNTKSGRTEVRRHDRNTTTKRTRRTKREMLLVRAREDAIRHVKSSAWFIKDGETIEATLVLDDYLHDRDNWYDPNDETPYDEWQETVDERLKDMLLDRWVSPRSIQIIGQDVERALYVVRGISEKNLHTDEIADQNKGMDEIK